eukprot:gene8915-59649_t
MEERLGRLAAALRPLDAAGLGTDHLMLSAPRLSNNNKNTPGRRRRHPPNLQEVQISVVPLVVAGSDPSAPPSYYMPSTGQVLLPRSNAATQTENAATQTETALTPA